MTPNDVVVVVVVVVVGGGVRWMLDILRRWLDEGFPLVDVFTRIFPSFSKLVLE